ncbi:MAG: nucleotidyltransferase domain-containing protein [Methanobrevibacter sp.]|jgi:predicted nucleotidyltransferase|nr:nucleotidyltransferase domain-containing protein [Methanobrevibacter sp.]
MIHVLDEEMEIIKNILNKHLKDCKVLVFGSRLKMTHKPFSDLDLAIICKEKLKLRNISDIEYEFSMSNLPYRVDIVDYNRASKEFQKIINNNKEKIHGS